MRSTPICLKTVLAIILLALAFNANAASKSDRAKEKRWEEQIVPSLMVGDALMLNADGVEFLALYAEPSTDKAKGAVIIMHGIGVHPAWADVIDPLRMELPEHGWHTLSLQMPILENEAEDEDYPPLFTEVPSRIQAGVDYLKNKGIKNIVISGHSMGTTMASHYLASSRDSAVTAYVSMGPGPGTPGSTDADSMANFKKISGINILDVYGSEDIKRVKNNMKDREPIGKKLHGSRYQVKIIEGGNHFYQGKQDALIKVVSDWLEVNAKRQ